MNANFLKPLYVVALAVAFSSCTKDNPIIKQKPEADTVRIDNPNATIEARADLRMPNDGLVDSVIYYRNNFTDTIPSSVRIVRASPAPQLSYGYNPKAEPPSYLRLESYGPSAATVPFFAVKREGTHSGKQDNYKFNANDVMAVTDFPPAPPLPPGNSAGVYGAVPKKYKPGSVLVFAYENAAGFSAAKAPEIDEKNLNNANKIRWQKNQ